MFENPLNINLVKLQVLSINLKNLQFKKLCIFQSGAKYCPSMYKEVYYKGKLKYFTIIHTQLQNTIKKI